jgi:tetratricopeptide (TPR) repeat protein
MWPQAAEYLLKALSSNPKLTLVLMQNSTVYKQIFASPAFVYSVDDEMVDAQSDAYILLLSSLHALGQYDKMLVIANSALARADLPKKDAFYYYAGLGLLGLNQTQKAFLLFQKSLSIEKNDPDVYFYIADIYRKTSQAPQARNALEISYSLHQKNDERFPYDQKVNLRFF